MTLVGTLSEVMGASEPAIRVLLTLLAGYPLALMYRQWFFGGPSEKQHSFFTVIGIMIMYGCFGVDVFHSMLDVCVCYVLCNHMTKIGRDRTVILSFTYFMGHLLYGYWHTASKDYDILWTLPHCVQTLRMIALVWDSYDGLKEEELSASQKETALIEPPSLLEICGYQYFFGSFLVGPHVSMRKFRQFVNGDFCDPQTKGPPDNFGAAMRRASIGVVYLALNSYFMARYSNQYFLGTQFANQGQLMKMFDLFVWFKLMCFRYVGVWTLTEGVCILTSLGYGEIKDNGDIEWNGVQNIDVPKFELGPTFQSIVDSFNINTNQWSGRYIFRRLKFLGNRTASQLGTLFFIAIWHGFHLGYFMCFLYEFLCIDSEKKAAIVRDSQFPKLRELQEKYAGVNWFVSKIIVWFCCVNGFIPFGFIKKEIWMPILSQVYYNGWVLMLILWPALTFYSAKIKAKER